MEKNNNEKDFIYGKNSILEALKNNPRRINKIIISKNIHSDIKINEIIEIAKFEKIVFQFVPKEKFVNFKDIAHQGIIAFVAPIEYMELDDFIELNKKNAKLVALDGVQDPHNLGAIIRTCVCAGFDGIILSQRKNTLVTSIVEKTSAGAVNHIPIILVNSLSSALERLKKRDYWIIAADAKGKDNYFEVDYTDMNIVIVMGSEGAGVSKTILNTSDIIVKIPMLCNFNSLNVSNAAAILIYEVTKQIVQKSKNNV